MKPANGSKTAIARSEYWRNLVKQQVANGQPVSVFCTERGLTEQSFYSWRKRLSGEAPVSFALVSTDGSAGNQGASLELELGVGQRLRILNGVDAGTLRTVLAVLRERA
ncbi:MAG: transposase [Acidobacteriales bacterium]|nr:transposase [Terriglobales bacterium]